MKITNKSNGSILLRNITANPIFLGKGESIIFSNDMLEDGYEQVVKVWRKKLKFEPLIESKEQETAILKQQASGGSGQPIVISWGIVEDKPQSSVQDIDLAVTQKHIHNNSEVLSKLTQGSDGFLYFNGLKVDTQADLSGLISQSTLNQTLQNYATKQEITRQNLVSILGDAIPQPVSLVNYSTTEEVRQLISSIQIPSVEGFISRDELATQLQSKLDSNALSTENIRRLFDELFITPEELQQAITQAKLSTSDGSSSIDLNGYLTEHEAQLQYVSNETYQREKAGFATQSNVETLLNEKVSNTTFTEKVAGLVEKADFTKAKLIEILANTYLESSALTGYATEQALQQAVNEINTEIGNKLSTATYNQDRDSFALKTEITQQALTTLLENTFVKQSDISGKLDESTYNQEKASFFTEDTLTKEILVRKLGDALQSSSGSVDLQNYSTTEQMNQAIQSAVQTVRGIDDPTKRSMNVGLGNNIPLFVKGKPVGVFDTDISEPFYRIPAMVTTQDGTSIVVTDYRSDAGDQVAINIVGAVSNNGFKDWTYVKIAERLGEPKDDYSRVMDSTLLATRSNKVFCLAGAWKSGTTNWTTANGTTADNYRLILSKTDSSSDYKTWTQSEINVVGKPQEVRAIIGGVGTGIQLKNGDLIFPIQYTKGPGTVFGGMIYSTDDGTTWNWSSCESNGISENNVVELPDGRILCIARVDASYGFKRVLITDNYKTGQYSEFSPLSNKLVVNGNKGCQGSTLYIETRNGVKFLLTTIPQNRKARTHLFSRDRITVYAIPMTFSEIIPIHNVNYDVGGLQGARTWRSPVTSREIRYNNSPNTPFGGYSCLSYTNGADGERLAICFEDNLGVSLTDLTPMIPTIENAILSSDKRLSLNKPKPLFKLGSIQGNKITNLGTWGDLVLHNPRNEIIADSNNEGFILFHNTVKNGGQNNTCYAYLDLSNERNKPQEVSISFDVIVNNEEASYDNWNTFFTFAPGATGNAQVGIGYENRNSTGNLNLNPINGGNGNNKTADSGIPYGTKLHIDYLVSGNSSAKLYVNGVLKRTDNVGFPGTYNRLIIGTDILYRKKQRFSIGNFVIKEGIIDPTQEVKEYSEQDFEELNLKTISENSNIKSGLLSALFKSSSLPSGNLTQVNYWNSLTNGSYLISSNVEGLPSGVENAICLVLGEDQKLIILNNFADPTKLYIQTSTTTQLNGWKSIQLT